MLIRITLLPMPQCRVEHPPTLKRLIPRDWVVIGVPAAMVGTFIHGKQEVKFLIHPTKVVPFFKMRPFTGQFTGGDMGGIVHDEGRRLRFGMPGEVCAHKPPEPIPFILCSGRAMDTHKTAASAYVIAEGILL